MKKSLIIFYIIIINILILYIFIFGLFNSFNKVQIDSNVAPQKYIGSIYKNHSVIQPFKATGKNLSSISIVFGVYGQPHNFIYLCIKDSINSSKCIYKDSVLTTTISNNLFNNFPVTNEHLTINKTYYLVLSSPVSTSNNALTPVTSLQKINSKYDAIYNNVKQNNQIDFNLYYNENFNINNFHSVMRTIEDNMSQYKPEFMKGKIVYFVISVYLLAIIMLVNTMIYILLRKYNIKTIFIYICIFILLLLIIHLIINSPIISSAVDY